MRVFRRYRNVVLAVFGTDPGLHWRTGAYEAFEGLCFVDTLDIAEKKEQYQSFEWFTEKNTERVERPPRADRGRFRRVGAARRHETRAHVEPDERSHLRVPGRALRTRR